MWSSNPPVYPQLTEEECNALVLKARMQKGQMLYSQAYAKRSKGVREFPDFTAKTFREWVVKRGEARAKDLGWDGFAIDQDNQDVLKLLALYFTRDERFEKIKDANYALRKGIFLIGPFGVGKSVLMELCDTSPHVCYTRHDCQVIAGEYTDKETGGQKVIDYYSAHGIPANTDATFGHTVTGRFFDDLGQEDIGNHFGNSRNVMANIIENRYRMGGYQLTHFTSNHTLDQLNDIYGPRVVDRLREMVNVIAFPHTAKSRRK